MVRTLLVGTLAAAAFLFAPGEVRADERASCSGIVEPLTGEGSCSFTYAGGSLAVEGIGEGPVAAPHPGIYVSWVCVLYIPVCIPVVLPFTSLPSFSSIAVSVDGPAGFLGGCQGVHTCGPTTLETDVEPGAVFICRAAIRGGGPVNAYAGRFSCASGE
jgi:hypothetical protein